MSDRKSLKAQSNAIATGNGKYANGVDYIIDTRLNKQLRNKSAVLQRLCCGVNNRVGYKNDLNTLKNSRYTDFFDCIQLFFNGTGIQVIRLQSNWKLNMYDFHFQKFKF